MRWQLLFEQPVGYAGYRVGYVRDERLVEKDSGEGFWVLELGVDLLKNSRFSEWS